MAKQKAKDNSWIKWLIVAGFLLVVILMGSLLDSDEDNYTKETYSSSSGTTTTTTNTQSLENIVFSGMNQKATVSSSNPSRVVISGMGCEITFTKTSNPQEIVLSGMNSKAILCEGIHNPKITQTAMDSEIEYVSC